MFLRSSGAVSRGRHMVHSSQRCAVFVQPCVIHHQQLNHHSTLASLQLKAETIAAFVQRAVQIPKLPTKPNTILPSKNYTKKKEVGLATKPHLFNLVQAKQEVLMTPLSNQLSAEDRQRILDFNPEHHELILEQYHEYWKKAKPVFTPFVRKQLDFIMQTHAAILNGTPIYHDWSKKLYFDKDGSILMENHKNAVPHTFHPDFFPKSRDISSINSWFAHKFILSAYRAMTRSIKKPFWIFLHLILTCPQFSPTLQDYNALFKKVRDFSPDTFEILPPTRFRTILNIFLWDMMLSKNVAPDPFSVSMAVAISEVEPSEFCLNIPALFLELKQAPDIITYSLLMNYLALNPNDELVTLLYEQMKTMELDQQAYVSAIRAALAVKNTNLLHEVFADLRRSFPNNLNTFTQNTIIHACLEQGQFLQAEKLLVNLMQTTTINTCTVNSLLALYQKRLDPRIIDFFDSAESRYGVELDHYSYGILLTYLIDVKDFTAAEQRYAELMSKGVNRSQVIHNLMAKCYAGQGNSDNILNLLSEMKAKRHRITNIFLGSMFQSYIRSNAKLAPLEVYFDPSNLKYFPAINIPLALKIMYYVNQLSYPERHEYTKKLWARLSETSLSVSAPFFDIYLHFCIAFLTAGDIAGYAQALQILRMNDYKPGKEEAGSLIGFLHALLMKVKNGQPTASGFVASYSAQIEVPDDVVEFNDRFLSSCFSVVRAASG